MPLTENKSLQILPMGFADIEAVYQVELQCHSHPWSKKLFLSNFGKRYFNHVILDEQRVIGYFVVSSVAGEVTLMNIAVEPNKQGTGIGRQLLQFLKDLSSSNGEQEIWLEVRASNSAALALYNRLGFSEVDRRKDYYPCIQGREDAIIMCCYL